MQQLIDSMLMASSKTIEKFNEIGQEVDARKIKGSMIQLKDYIKDLDLAAERITVAKRDKSEEKIVSIRQRIRKYKCEAEEIQRREEINAAESRGNEEALVPEGYTTLWRVIYAVTRKTRCESLPCDL